MGHRVAPDRLVDLLALEHLALRLGEQLEQLELAPREVDAAAAHERLELVGADLELAGHERTASDALGRALAPPDHGLHAREHLLGVAGLRDPVVGAGAQAAHALRDARCGPCRRRRPCPGSARGHALEELPARRARAARGRPPARSRASRRTPRRAEAPRGSGTASPGRRPASPALARTPSQSRGSRFADPPSPRSLGGWHPERSGVHSLFTTAATLGITDFPHLGGTVAPPWSSESSRSARSEYLALASGRPLQLTVRELDLLTALAERRDRIVSREELYQVVWDEPYRKTDRSVDVYIARLRQKLDEASPRPRVHPHALRVRLPPFLRLSRVFTSFSQDGAQLDNRLAARADASVPGHEEHSSLPSPRAAPSRWARLPAATTTTTAAPARARAAAATSPAPSRSTARAPSRRSRRRRRRPSRARTRT